jgi:hypothetical protein
MFQCHLQHAGNKADTQRNEQGFGREKGRRIGRIKERIKEGRER